MLSCSDTRKQTNCPLLDLGLTGWYPKDLSWMPRPYSLSKNWSLEGSVVEDFGLLLCRDCLAIFQPSPCLSRSLCIVNTAACGSMARAGLLRTFSYSTFTKAWSQVMGQWTVLLQVAVFLAMFLITDPWSPWARRGVLPLKQKHLLVFALLSMETKTLRHHTMDIETIVSYNSYIKVVYYVYWWYS